MNRIRASLTAGVMALATLVTAEASSAQNIDVSTLPPRDAVQLTIYNSEDLTLVRESRHVTVRKGSNELQFSWANTLIDPTSVELELRTKGLELLDTRYPHDRPQALYWTVTSSFDGDAEVEISYFTSGISWSADYVGVAEGDESSMRFEGYVTVTNGSGEDYEDAQIRMVVGTINLVEKIRDLAQRGLLPPEVANAVKPGAKFRDMPAPARRAGKAGFPAPSAGGGGGGGFADAEAPPEIVKEGLSEYFIFTVPGEQTVKNGWSKRMRLFEGTKVPVKTVYRYRPTEYGNELVRLFLVRNDEKSTLGTTPLPDGAVRLFRTQQGASAAGGLSVISFVQTKYVPIGQEFEFNLGRDPQVIWERQSKRTWRDDFWFKRGEGVKLFSPDKGERIEPNDAVAGWTDHEQFAERIRNYRAGPIEVEFRFPLDGDVTFASSLSPTLFDYRTPEFKSSVKAGETRELGYELVRKQGTSAKQNAVTLEAK
ncbi:MAG: hypothetical protein U0572_15520 [Phycisphaerales bacterium]